MSEFVRQVAITFLVLTTFSLAGMLLVWLWEKATKPKDDEW